MTEIPDYIKPLLDKLSDSDKAAFAISVIYYSFHLYDDDMKLSFGTSFLFDRNFESIDRFISHLTDKQQYHLALEILSTIEPKDIFHPSNPQPA